MVFILVGCMLKMMGFMLTATGVLALTERRVPSMNVSCWLIKSFPPGVWQPSAIKKRSQFTPEYAQI